MAALPDGNLGTSNPNDADWPAYPPTGKNIESVIDPGQPTEVFSVAVNLPVNHPIAMHFPENIDVPVSENGIGCKHSFSGRSDAVLFDKHAHQLNLSEDIAPGARLVLINKPAVVVRHVKIEIVPDASGKTWVYLDEFMANPATK